MALLAGVLTAVLCSHALPLARETNAGRSTLAIASAPTAFVIPNPFPSASLGAPARASRSRRSVPCSTYRRIPASCGCRLRRRRAGAGAVSFGSRSVAGVEGSAWASEATAAAAAAAAGFDRDPVARGLGVDGGVGAPAGAADEIDDEAVKAFSSAAAAAASKAVVDEGELICQQLEGVVSREVEVADQEILLRVAHLDDYFAIAGEYIRKFHRPLPWSWELICRQLEEVISQEAEMADEQILLRMANLDDYFAIACECISVSAEVFRSFGLLLGLGRRS